MGVTIHFEGKLKSEKDYGQLLQKSIAFATKHQMDFEQFSSDKKLLARVANEQEWNYEGPVKGLKIFPSENCEPLWLEFDENLVIQDFCKTQFAGTEVHIAIVELFDSIQEHFSELSIYDEAEYWETRDIERLNELFNETFGLIDEAKTNDPTLEGPFRTEDGRIIDLSN